MTLHAPTPIPAGWYPDPQGSFQQRWWDGAAWTNEFAQYRPTLNFTPQVKPSAVAQQIPVYAPAAPATPATLNPPAPRADLLGAEPVAAAAVAEEPVVQQPNPVEPPTPIQFEGAPLQPTSPEHLLRVQPAGTTAPAAPPTSLETDPLFDTVRPSVPATPARHVKSGEPVAGEAPSFPSAASAAVAPIPSPAASVGDEGTDNYQPFGYTAHSIAPRQKTKPKPRYTLAAWVLAIVPAIGAGAAVAIAYFAPLFYSFFAVSILGLVTLALLIGLGYADSARLRFQGHERTVPGILGALGPVYFIARVFVVARQTGRPGIWLLMLSLVVCGAIAAAYFVVPGLAVLVTTLSI